MDTLIGDHQKKTGNQIAIVTLVIDSAAIKTMQEFEQVSLAWVKKWGVAQREKDNGVAIIFSKNVTMMRIEVGEGLVSALTNTETTAIIDDRMIPEFKKSNYFDGT